MQSEQVRGEVKALDASAEIRALTDSIREYAIFLLDPLGIVLTWNTGAQEIKGYAPAEIIGQSFVRFYPQEDRAAGRPQALLAEAARNGHSEQEGWRLRKDGSRFWADVVISALRDGNGALIGYVKVTRDLTERRLAEENLRQSEERARLTVASVKDYAIFMLDPEGRIASWNSGAELTKGYRADEAIGRHSSLFYTPEDLAAGRPQRLLSTARAEGRVEDQGWRVKKDGSRFWADVVISRVDDEAGRLVGFTKVTRDLSDRKRAEEEAIERTRQQAAVSELGLYALRTPQLAAVMERAVSTVAETLRIDDVRILREGEPPAPGASTVGIHAPEPEADFAALAASGSRSLGPNDVSFLQAIANVVAAAIGRARNEEQLRIAEGEAIAERGRADQAHQALRERDDFISVAAHELRTPLTALHLKLQGLERGATPDRQPRLAGAVRQAERLSRLIDRLLDVSRIAEGRAEMAPESFDLSLLVRQVTDDFREPAVQARVSLQLQVPETLEGCWDRLRMEQVVVNLLSNAVKYGAGKPISVNLESEGDKVRLAVTDRGIGIAPEDVSRIFGRFQRAASLRNYGGLGLGLYVTRHIVEAHGGTISVTSTLGEGATFVVELPRRVAPPAAVRDGEPRARA
jgi:PAS domain S-box-containing protein